MANMEHKDGTHGAKKGHSHHHILTDKTVLVVGTALACLTILTVTVAQIDLGALNFPVAMLIATTKGLLVALFFMNLLYDSRENGVIFFTSFLFLAIFITLTSTDLFFRGDVYLRPGELTASASPNKSKLTNPWISTPELIAHGKEMFSQQCVSCHGPEGYGNGIAGAALNPHPRNFHQTADWVNGRMPSQIFKTLKEGVPGSSMASFATLAVDDRWALAAFVGSLGPKQPAETAESLAKIGYDIKTGRPMGGAEQEKPTIPVELAMERMTQPEAPVHAVTLTPAEGAMASAGGQLYQNRCASCHGGNAEGGIRVRGLGGYPHADIATAALTAETNGVRSSDAFNRIVIEGIPGRLMPGNAQLSGSELSELYSYVRNLASRNR